MSFLFDQQYKTQRYTIYYNAAIIKTKHNGKCINVHFILWTPSLTNMHVLFFCPGCQQSEAARVSTSLQPLRLTSYTHGRGSQGHVHAQQLPLRLLHPLPGGFPRLDPLQSGAAPNQDDPHHTRKRSEQEEHQAPVMELN